MPVLILTFILAACGQSGTSAESSESTKDILADNGGASEPAAAEYVQDMTEKENPVENENLTATDKQTPITLTIGDTVLEGYLNDSLPAQSLIAQLPLTVTLNDSDNDFCGDSLTIEYGDSDVTSGYKDGELAFWTPANNFVIFVSGEEDSANTGNLVILGKITEPQETLDALEGTIDVTIALVDGQSEEADSIETAKEENSDSMVQRETDAAVSTEAENNTIINEREISEVKIKITVGEMELIATMEENATTQAIIEQMPMTLSMMDLYGREMCYRYVLMHFPPIICNQTDMRLAI